MPRTRVCSSLTQPSRLRLVHTSLFPFLTRAPTPFLFFSLVFSCSFHAPLPSPLDDNLPFLILPISFFLSFSLSVAFRSEPRLPSPSVRALCAPRCPFVFLSSRQQTPLSRTRTVLATGRESHLTRTRCYGTTVGIGLP